MRWDVLSILQEGFYGLQSLLYFTLVFDPVFALNSKFIYYPNAGLLSLSKCQEITLILICDEIQGEELWELVNVLCKHKSLKVCLYTMKVPNEVYKINLPTNVKLVRWLYHYKLSKPTHLIYKETYVL